MTTTKDSAHDVLVAAAQHSIAGHADTDSRIDRARRTLAAAAPIMLAPTPTATPPRVRARRRVIRLTRQVITYVVVGSALTAGAVYYGVTHGYLEFPGTGDPVANTVADPAPPATDIHVAEDMLDRAGYYTRLAEEEAARQAEEQAAADAAAAAAAAAAAPPDAPTDPGTTAPGGTHVNPPAGVTTPPPAGGGTPSVTPKVSSIDAQVFSSVGEMQVEVYVTTTNGAVTVSATASIDGVTSTTLSGPSSLDGSATYTGTLTGIPAGTYTVNIYVNDKTLHVTAPAY